MNFISRRAAAVSPYVAGEQPKDKAYIKLNTNENPYAPSSKVAEVFAHFPFEELKLYPDPSATDLTRAIAMQYGVGEKNVFVGNGSDEVLAFLFPAFFDEGDNVAFADITYSFYPVYANFFNVKADIVPLKDFRMDKADYFNYHGKGILLCNPNAPTGTALAVSEIEEILQKNSNLLVVVDEAYADFAEESAVSLVKNYDNLLVVRTFSKSYALAGIRLGFALGSAALIDALERVKNSINSYTVDRVAQQIGIAALNDNEYFLKRVADVKKTRERTVQTLTEAGFRVLPSAANFLFVEVGEGKRYYTTLRERGILVRFFDKPDLNRFLRVTIGTEEEMDVFLKEILAIRGIK